jgi:hypothetical protein
MQAIVFISGCDTLNWQQYRVAGVTVNSPDEVRISALLKKVADQCELVDITSKSRVPNTLVLYSQQNVTSFRTELGARYYQGDVLVDVYAGWGPPRNAKFKQTKGLVTSALTNEFASRCCGEGPPVAMSH